jgi:hypothetical protein
MMKLKKIQLKKGQKTPKLTYLTRDRVIRL